MITLYHDPVSTNSWKVRLVLAEKGLPHEEVVFDVRHRRDHKAPAYLAIHPYGRVPAIVDDGFAVYDSTLINEYLEDRYPEVPLMPPDARGRARQRMLEDFRDSDFHPAFSPLLRELRNKPAGQADRAVVDEAVSALEARMPRLEEALAGTPYLAAERFSIADAAFVPNFAYLEQWEVPVPARFERLRAWFARCKARPAYARAEGLPPPDPAPRS